MIRRRGILDDLRRPAQANHIAVNRDPVRYAFRRSGIHGRTTRERRSVLSTEVPSTRPAETISSRATRSPPSRRTQKRIMRRQSVARASNRPDSFTRQLIPSPLELTGSDLVRRRRPLILGLWLAHTAFRGVQGGHSRSERLVARDDRPLWSGAPLAPQEGTPAR